MRFLSVCSGIEAASVAWNPLGWKAAAFSEIEPFPCSLLAHHYPEVPNRGDMTKFESWPDDSIDLLCGGTPCQSFSVAGLRAGLADPRGNLMLTYGAIAAKYRPRWLVWENVPGVLSSNGGRDFGSFLGLLGQLGYGFAFRVLDAQYFGVPQRRRRVFVVGCLGDWRSAAAVLFERHSLSGHPAPSRAARTSVAALTACGVGTCGADDNQGQAGHLIAYAPDVTSTMLARSSRGGGQTNSPGHQADQQLVAIGFDCKASGRNGFGIGEVASTQRAMGHAGSHRNGGGHQAVMAGLQVRRLMPEECEALQGFKRGYTAIPHRGKPAADGPRYKALGNSWAVPCARWIGERIDQVEAITAPSLLAA